MNIVSGKLAGSKTNPERSYTCLFGVEAYPVLHIQSGADADRYLLDECNGGPDGRAFLLAKEDEPGTIYDTYIHRNGSTAYCSCPAYTCRKFTCKHILSMAAMIRNGHLDHSADQENVLAGGPDFPWPPEPEPDFAEAFGAN